MGRVLLTALVGPNAKLEQASIRATCDALLAEVERHPADPKPADMPPDAQASIPGAVAADPALALTLPAWTGGAVTPACITVLRDPGAVLNSVMTGLDLPLKHAELLWQAYLLVPERASRDLPRCEVRIEDISGSGRAEAVARVAETLAPGDAEVAAKLQRAATAVLDPALLRRAVTGPDALEMTLSLDLWDVMTRPDSPGRRAELDRVYAAWRKDWHERSSGKGASRFAQRLPGWHVSRAGMLTREGRLTEATEALQEAARRAPMDAGIRFELASGLWRDNQYGPALDELTRLIDLEPHAARYRLLRARVLHRLRQGERALADLDAALRIQPTQDEALHLRGLVQERLGALEAARGDLQQALELSPGRPATRAALSRINTQLAGGASGGWQLSRPVSSQALPEDEADALAEAQELAGQRKALQAYKRLAPLLVLPQVSAQTIDYGVTLLDTLGRTEQLQALVTRIASQRTLLPETQIVFARHRAEAGAWDEATALRDAALAAFARAPGSGAGGDLNAPSAVPKHALGLSLRAWALSRRWAAQFDLITETPQAGQDDWPRGTTLGAFATAPIMASPDTCELSVMLPVHNVTRPDWLRGAVDSVLAQDGLPDRTEIVLVADGPQDTALIAELCARDPRIRAEDTGAAHGILENHNRCLTLARGTYVHILHQDDFLRPGFYTAMLGPLRETPRLSMAFCATEVLDGEDRTQRITSELRRTRGILDNWQARIAHSQLVRFPAVVLRRTTTLQLGGFSPSLNFAFDWHYWARAATVGDVWFDPLPAAVRRNHAGSATHAFDGATRYDEMMRVAARHLLMLPKDMRAAALRHVFHRVTLNGLRLATAPDAGPELARRVHGLDASNET